MHRLPLKPHSDHSAKIAIPVKAVAGDPLFQSIAALYADLRRAGENLFFAWSVARTYSRVELEAAKRFQLIPAARFAPEGERCGTVYDESTACPHCGAGGRIAEGLFVSQTRLPKTSDIAMSIAREIIVSQRLVDVFEREGISGVTFRPIHKKRREESGFCGWYEWSVASAEAEIAPPTRVGDSPFEPDAEGHQACPAGDIVGRSLLSELTVAASSIGSADVVSSRQYIGTRSGVLRPRRLILVSPKVMRCFETHDLKGARFEVAHQV